MELRVVHLAQIVDEFLEELAAFFEIFEVEVDSAELVQKVEHVALALDRAEGIDRVEGILLEEHEIEQFGLPEVHVVAYRHTVVSEDVDLLVGLTTLPDEVLGLLDLCHPSFLDMLVEVLDDFRVFEVFRI